MSLVRIISAFAILAAVCLFSASAAGTMAQEELPFPVFIPSSDGLQSPQAVLGIAIDAGYNHSCMINIDHKVFCWGSNSEGQLGNGSTSPSSYPVPVIGLTEDVVAISAGYQHTCAVTASGAAKCWGNGSSGQLGHGKWESSLSPVQVTGLLTTTLSISAGYQHTCAVVVPGAARCWGAGSDGQLGNNATNTSTVPVTPSGLTSSITGIGAGEEHSCAIQASGVKCWGDNYYGQLGNGTQTWTKVPVNVISLSGTPAQIAVGTFGNCVRNTSGAVQCWGFRAIIGDGSTVCYNGNVWQTSPHAIANMSSGVTDVAVGNAHACAVKDGGAWCWGDGRNGELGNGQTPSLEVCTPVGVTGLSSGVSKISVGKFHTISLLSGGTAAEQILADESGVRAWGKNDQGQLGIGTSGPIASTPVVVLPPVVVFKLNLPAVMR